jgi:multimeric flavodoxin WrbA
MKNLLIVYHSQSGNTQALARAVAEGSDQESEANIRLKTAFKADLDDLLWAHGLLFGTPENFGTMSGALKDFFDRTFYPAEPYKLNLPYAIFISAENDGTGAVREIDQIALGYPLRKIAEPLIIKGEVSSSDIQAAQEFGLAMAAGLCLGIY